jgi:hypothetical protein
MIVPAIAFVDVEQTIVTAALVAKSSAETSNKARWKARSETMRRSLAGERGRIGSAHGGNPGDGIIAVGQLPCRVPVVVFDASLALLLLGEPDVEVGGAASAL